MKHYKLAEGTLDSQDYQIMIDFLKKKKTLTQSINTKKFEKKFSNYLGRKHSIFVNSGSSANLLIAQTLLEGSFLKNRVVVVPAVSWSTTVSPFLQLGYEVILCDCDPLNLGLDTKQLEKICKKFKPSLVVVVNVLGHSNNFKEINKIQKKYNFKIMEDNCESMGSKKNNKKLGCNGISSSHSFYYGHHISTIEGGIISTDNKEFYNVALSIRSHGWARDVESKYKKNLEKKFNVDEFKSLYTFYFSGLNIRSTDFNAEIGLNQLKKINRISIKRHKNFNYYKKKLNKFWLQDSDLSLISSFGYATFVKNRLEVFRYLKSKNIQSRPLICGNMNRQPFIRKKKLTNFNLENSEFVDKYGLYLPNHANLTFEDIDFICKSFSKIAKPIFK
jgi:CDP-4-dehydro-6-deoxyglucose reductase, E1